MAHTAFPAFGFGMKVEPGIALTDPLVNLLECKTIWSGCGESLVNEHAVVLVGLCELFLGVVLDLELERW